MANIKQMAPLSVMLGSGVDFIVQDKKYTMMPMSVAHVNEFFKDDISLGSQFFVLVDENRKALLNKWMGEVSVELADGTVITTKYLTNDKGELMTVDKAMADGWSIVDLRNYVKKLCDISG